MRPDFRPLDGVTSETTSGRILERDVTGMKSKVNLGSIINEAAGTTLGRPGNSAAEKMRAFSGASSMDVGSHPVFLSRSQDSAFLKNSPQYKLINREPTPDTKSQDANQIDANVFIGNSNSAQNLEWLTSRGITHVLNTASELPNFFIDGSKGYRPRYFNLELRDEPMPGGEDLLAVLELSFRWISGVIRINPNAKILVHCHMGKSRSASIVIYYLMRSRGWSYGEALTFAQSKRPIVSPNMWYAQQLRDADKMLSANTI